MVLVCLVLVGCGRGATPSDAVLDGPPKAPVVEKSNVVIFLADTLRADVLGCYGFALDTSPTIDAFAEKSYVFENTFAQSSWTKPSVASMLTGYLPSVHQAVLSSSGAEAGEENVQVLRESFVTLAEQFKSAGYTTALFTINGHCKKEFGFAQGFDHYWFRNMQDPAKQMDEVLDWLHNKSTTPFLLYVHVSDPHHPYIPPRKYYDALYDDRLPLTETDREIVRDYWRVYAEWAGRREPDDGVRLDDISRKGVEQLKRLYTAEVRYVDAQFKRLLDGLSQRGIRDQTTIAFLSDHGEEFKEHGTIGHGRTLYDEVTRVPLIISQAGKHEKARVRWNVRMFDLYPTLLTLAGLEVPDGIQAESLFNPEGSLAVREDRLIISELDLSRRDHKEWIVSMIDGLNRIVIDRSTDTVRVFNRYNDPGEFNPEEPDQHNLSRFGRTRSLWNKLSEAIDQNDTLSDQLGSADWTAMDSETLELLSNLGYVQ